MARSGRSPARLVVALSIAGLLAVFLIYTALHGSTPALQPSNLAGHAGTVSLTGKVSEVIPGSNSHTTGGLRFALHNINGPSPTIPIVYHGSVPDLFENGRDVNVTGQMENGAFVATALTTKCPSKYTAKA
ncbi:MAG TPA: cytochrome c maturation protein CcmE [Gaiellaceae bacterium]|jgi:cytochrome c-type biogenesis protein CcmE|nr:cytochrome c maturation protein CcmE [Gaiellaceae bacterium]